MKKLWVILVVYMMATFTFIQAETSKPITVKVNGLVCSFCAQGLKKRFMVLPMIKIVQVSLGKKTVVIELKPDATLSDKMITDAVREAGYNTVRIDR